MQRRNLLKAVGGIGAATAVGGVGLATIGGAAAEVTFDPDTVTHTSVDGEISAVLLDVSGSVKWSGFDSGASDYDVALYGDVSGTEEELASITGHDLGSQEGAKQTGEDGVSFAFDTVDLTEVFGDDEFAVDTDGDSENITVDLRVDVVINQEDEGTFDTETNGTLTVSHRNQASAASTDADIGAGVAFAGDIYDKDDIDTEEDAYIEFDFSRLDSDGVVVMRQRLQNWYSGVASGAPANSPIAFDVDEDGTRDFQLGWRPGISGPEYGYLDESGSSGWEDTTSSANGISISSETDDGTGYIVWEVDASHFGVSESGDSFRAGGNATAGGEEEYVSFSDDNSESPFAPANMLTVIVP